MPGADTAMHGLTHRADHQGVFFSVCECGLARCPPLPQPQGAVKETHVTCTACAGTLLLEFGLLSHLTGQCRFPDNNDLPPRRIGGISLVHDASLAAVSVRVGLDLVMFTGP